MESNVYKITCEWEPNDKGQIFKGKEKMLSDLRTFLFTSIAFGRPLVTDDPNTKRKMNTDFKSINAEASVVLEKYIQKYNLDQMKSGDSVQVCVGTEWKSTVTKKQEGPDYVVITRIS